MQKTPPLYRPCFGCSGGITLFRGACLGSGQIQPQSGMSMGSARPRPIIKALPCQGPDPMLSLPSITGGGGYRRCEQMVNPGGLESAMLVPGPPWPGPDSFRHGGEEEGVASLALAPELALKAARAGRLRVVRDYKPGCKAITKRTCPCWELVCTGNLARREARLAGPIQFDKREQLFR